MSNQQIINALHQHGIRTMGDLDAWSESRGLTRAAALVSLVGPDAADLIIGILAVRIARARVSPHGGERRSA
jgi:hypothetical protein